MANFAAGNMFHLIGKDMKITPKYSFEMLYVSPLTKKLSFDEKELKTIYVPMQKTRQKTGIEAVDTVVDCLIAGKDPVEWSWQL